MAVWNKNGRWVQSPKAQGDRGWHSSLSSGTRKRQSWGKDCFLRAEQGQHETAGTFHCVELWCWTQLTQSSPNHPGISCTRSVHFRSSRLNGLLYDTVMIYKV
jgi:hypothetical protein